MTADGSVVGMFVIFLAAFSSRCGAQNENPVIRITPSTSNITLFEGSEFRRVCEVTGVSDDVTVSFFWERDGSFLDRIEGADHQLPLYISAVEKVHEGEYSCHVEVTTPGGQTILRGPTSAGALTVLERVGINAPPVQVIREGTTDHLNCSYTDPTGPTIGLVTWRLGQNGRVVTGSFTPATFADENLYTCDIYIPASAASTRVPVMLFVVAPVEVLGTSHPVHQNLTSNRPVVLAVDFRGRTSHGLTITWLHNSLAVAPDDSRIHNSMDSTLGSGRTEFRFSQARRSDAGLYHVVLRNQVGGEGAEPPIFSSQQEVTFQIDVTVKPRAPTNLHVDQISSRTAHVAWTWPANLTPDEAAEQLELRLTFANHSFADLVRLRGDLTSASLQNLIPAHDYLILLTSINSDGEVTTNPVSFSTSTGFPAISNLEVERVNRTFFVLDIHLAYTGGGAIDSVQVWYKPQAERRLETLLTVDPEQISPLTFRAVVILTDGYQQHLVEHEAGMQLTFRVQVENELFFSGSSTVNVSAYVAMVTTSLPGSTVVVSPPASSETELLPLWLIAVIASVVTILIMLVLLACVVAMCVHCRVNKSSKFRVEAPPTSTLDMTENGMSDNIPAEQFRGRSQSSSVPSDQSLDGHFKKHRRELSESSSVGVGKVVITPSTTASNSPSNFSKFLNSQEKGLDSITELELVSRGSDGSGTESERDRMRQQQQIAYQQKLMSASPCSRNNMLNYQYVQVAPYCVRGHADGSVCGSSHQSLVSSCHHSIGCLPTHCSDLKHHHPPSKRRAGVEYMYSDCESVASTDVSCSNASLSSSYNTPHTKHHRPVQYRSPTPYNHDYPLTEGSVV